MEFTHFDEQGNARMVDVTAKGETVREAVAKGRIRVSEDCFGKLKEGTMAKGDVLGVARIAGVEMEARTGVSVTLLTIYDMCKAVDKAMEIGDIHLAEKTGGKSGHFVNPREQGGEQV